MTNFSRIIFCFFFIGLISCTAEQPEIKVTAKVQKMPLQQIFTLTGQVIPKKRSIVQSQFNGYINKLFVKVGDKVKKGDPLVTITTSLQSNEEAFPMKSPLDGTVVSINKQAGESVQANAPAEGIMQVDDLTGMKMDALAPEMDILNVKINQDVLVKINSITDKIYHGKVTEVFLAARVNQQNPFSSEKVEFPVKIDITDFDEKIKSGMSGLADIVAATKESALALPHEFIKMKEGKFEVKLKSGGTKEVKIGVQTDQFVEVFGLEEDEEVERIDLYE